MQHMHDNLTGYKRPRYVEFRESLPTTNVGKILRRELRDEELQAGPQEVSAQRQETPPRRGFSFMRTAFIGSSGRSLELAFSRVLLGM